jgi:hypothetical protein
MHNQLTLRPQSGDPTTSATQTALYNKLVSTIPELFFRPNNSQTAIQLTYPTIKADSSNTQYSFVAGPFVVYAGLLTGVTDGQVITLSPSTTLLYVGLTVTNFKVNNPVGVSISTATNISGSSFTVRFLSFSGATTRDIYYIAIGQ